MGKSQISIGCHKDLSFRRRNSFWLRIIPYYPSKGSSSGPGYDVLKTFQSYKDRGQVLSKNECDEPCSLYWQVLICLEKKEATLENWNGGFQVDFCIFKRRISSGLSRNVFWTHISSQARFLVHVCLSISIYVFPVENYQK